MPSGGRREGRPGRSYGNRTDLNDRTPKVMTATGQEYGKATAQREVLRAAKNTPPPAAVGPSPQGVPLPQPPGLFDPSERPGEATTAGLEGVQVMPEPAAPDDHGAILRAIYLRNPHPDLAALIAELDDEGATL